MADSEQKTDQATDPTCDENSEEMCRICFEAMVNRSLTDTCLHSFCLQCLRLWSQNHNICPFCRRIYRNILGNYISATEFDLIPVTHVGAFDQPDHDPLPGPIADLVDQLRNIQEYNRLQEQYYLNLHERLNHLNVESMEYLLTLQMIADLEDRLEENHQRLAMIRINLRNAVIQHTQASGPPVAAIGQPVDGAVNRQPVDGAVNRQPVDGAVNRQPVDGAVNRQPVDEEVNGQQPNQNIDQEVNQKEEANENDAEDDSGDDNGDGNQPSAQEN